MEFFCLIPQCCLAIGVVISGVVSLCYQSIQISFVISFFVLTCVPRSFWLFSRIEFAFSVSWFVGEPTCARAHKNRLLNICPSGDMCWLTVMEIEDKIRFEKLHTLIAKRPNSSFNHPKVLSASSFYSFLNNFPMNKMNKYYFFSCCILFCNHYFDRLFNSDYWNSIRIFQRIARLQKTQRLRFIEIRKEFACNNKRQTLFIFMDEKKKRRKKPRNKCFS